MYIVLHLLPTHKPAWKIHRGNTGFEAFHAPLKQQFCQPNITRLQKETKKIKIFLQTTSNHLQPVL
jgi:hypothetical protein